MYDAGNITGLVRRIKMQLRLSSSLRIGYVNSGGLMNAPAWIEFPASLPLYGSHALRQITITMYIRKSFLQHCSFEQLVAAIAHELSHLVLTATNHQLENSEEAVDLLAMMLGFRNYFREGYRPLTDYCADTVTKLGYLTVEEVNYAADLMERSARSA